MSVHDFVEALRRRMPKSKVANHLVSLAQSMADHAPKHCGRNAVGNEVHIFHHWRDGPDSYCECGAKRYGDGAMV